MSRPELSFAQRLATARRLIATGWDGSLPEHQRAQLEDAALECEDQLQYLGFVSAIQEPDRGWRRRSGQPDPEQRAYLLASVLDCVRTLCPHLRRGTPQPAYALLPLRRMDCRRCAAVLRMPPPEDGDRCDMCGTRGVRTFFPFAVASGPTLISGEVCSSCAGALGIREIAA